VQRIEIEPACVPWECRLVRFLRATFSLPLKLGFDLAQVKQKLGTGTGA
jgi:hypothetical protein